MPQCKAGCTEASQAPRCSIRISQRYQCCHAPTWTQEANRLAVQEEYSNRTLTGIDVDIFNSGHSDTVSQQAAWLVGEVLDYHPQLVTRLTPLLIRDHLVQLLSKVTYQDDRSKTRFLGHFRGIKARYPGLLESASIPPRLTWSRRNLRFKTT